MTRSDADGSCVVRRVSPNFLIVVAVVGALHASVSTSWAGGVERGALERSAWIKDFEQDLCDLASGRIGKMEMADSSFSLRKQAVLYDHRSAMPELFVLWLREDPVEIFWWQKDERVARAFVVALYIGMWAEEGLDSIPDFVRSARRFAPAEAAEREEEIRFVERYRSAIAGLLVGAYRAHDMAKVGGPAYAAYEAMVRHHEGDVLRCPPPGG